ncbi:hypothetical protein SAMN05421819_1587 [Bryocella elongata]|uniref:Uncharacterized protein n=1 Tax=Bryocella elongata TaxID=863522 RepID=A0A1H5WH96_9BACT|nr:hypothetical protein [Bryocella elongata]SEF99009.1 hypothetical protein SAMN05421819_1587 [Bryocella elongata]
MPQWRIGFGMAGLCLATVSLFTATAGCAPAPARPAAKPATAATGANTFNGCPVFPADNVWNTPVDKLPVSDKTPAYIASIGAAAKVHPDFGQDPGNGFWVSQVPTGTKWVQLEIEYRDDSDLGSYPMPAHPHLEAGGDSHILLMDTRRCLLYELFGAHQLPTGVWHVGSASKFDLTSNALREDGKTSADAAGLPILPGLVRYDEVASGEIHHAIRFTVPRTQKAHIWPARHDASSQTDETLPPMGMRMRLRANFDISGFPAKDQVILRAMKRYGMILADNGSAIFISGLSDPRWNDDELHSLGRVTARDFEVVDESAWQMLPNSGRVDPLELQAIGEK